MATEKLNRLALGVLGTGLAEDGLFLVMSENYRVTTAQLPPELACGVN